MQSKDSQCSNIPLSRNITHKNKSSLNTNSFPIKVINRRKANSKLFEKAHTISVNNLRETFLPI